MKTILILAANPKDTTQLRLAEEVREIEGVLQQAGIAKRNALRTNNRWHYQWLDVSCIPFQVAFGQ